MSYLTNCPTCNHEVSSDAQSCPNCGHVLNDKPDVVGGIINVLAVLFIGGYFLSALLAYGVVGAVGAVIGFFVGALLIAAYDKFT